ncbi:MAG: HD domain-containing protein [Patescibacteria group bacterium]|jgi:HD superfamily phosphodiesterase
MIKEKDFKITMNQIWILAKPYLEMGTMKNFIIHSKGVLLAMTMLLKKEKGDKEILLPAAILHDVGFSKVSKELQKSNDKAVKTKVLRQHLEFAPEIIKEILNKVGYNKNDIDEVIQIVIAHKFQDPKELDKQLLIDADTLSDVFKEQFYSDAKAYNKTPQEFYNVRKDNKFYTKTAKNIFYQELKNRKEEIFIKK